MSEIMNLTALELSAAIKEKKYSVPEVIGAYIDTIEKTDSQLNAFITVAKERALSRALEIQTRINKGETLSPLAGVPIALKDNITTLGIETTCGSKMLKGYTPVFNATAAEKLEQAGMIIVGKLNMDEFAMGGDSDKSAIAVAAGLVPLSLGSDTGGGIRQPCALSGVTGIKPTYGVVSRHGLIANASSLDQIGPIGKNIDDCAALLSIISGTDKANVKTFVDGTCVLEKPFNFEQSSRRLNGIKIGIADIHIDDDVRLACLAAAKEFEAAGAVTEEFEMPLMDYMLPVYCIIACAEASSNLARFDGLKFGYRSADVKSLSEVYRLSRSEGFGAEVKKRIMFGSFVLSAERYETYFKKAMQVRSLVKGTYNKLFGRFDMILSPVAPITSPLDVSVNLAGLPAAALPCGSDAQGLPIGFQLIGSAFSEEKLVTAARVFQSRTEHHRGVTS